MMVSGAPSQCILQWIERAYQSANEEARRWVWNQPNPPEDPSGRFRLTVFSMDIVGAMMRAIARAHRRYGTTSCLPTLISDTRAKATAAIAAAKLLDGTDGILGLHLEGPFISRARPG